MLLEFQLTKTLGEVIMQNPLKTHLTDDAFQFLIKNNLLREKGIRDFHIRQQFNELKKNQPTYLIIEMIQNEFPYLQYETIRKIIYQKPENKLIDIANCCTV